MREYFIIFVISVFIFACSDSAKLNPLTANATVLAFGDSLTYGSGARREKAYPAVLESLIHFRVINAGVPGETSQNGLLRLEKLLQQHQPELVILCHGGNDILNKMDMKITARNIQRMIDLAKQNDAQVVLISVPEFGLLLRPLPLYRQLAENNRIPVENDILSDILSDNSLKADYVHPNSKGYQLLAERINKLLEASGAI
jgi:lysophospholipase L1-like esterase